MAIDPTIVTRYRKVLVHAQRGEGNERSNAQRTLDKMERKYPGIGAQAAQEAEQDAQAKATADWARRAAHAAHAAQATRAVPYPTTGKGPPTGRPEGIAFWVKFIQDAIEDAATVGGEPPSARVFVQSIDFGTGFVATLKRKAAESFADWADDQIAARIAVLRTAEGSPHNKPPHNQSSTQRKRGHNPMAKLTEKEVIARLEDEGVDIEAFHCTDDDNGEELVQVNILIPLELWDGIKEHPSAFFAVVEEQLDADDGGPDEDGDPEELDGDLDEEAEADEDEDP